jgi:diguanylate cyclase (GGDEF)-like protein
VDGSALTARPRSALRLGAVVAAALALAAIIAVPDGSRASVLLTLAVEVVAVVVFVTVAVRMPPQNRGVWSLLAANLLLVLVGDVVYDVMLYGFGLDPFPSWPDIFYFASYVPQAVALVVLIGRRQRIWDLSAWIDATVATAAVFVIGAPIIFVPMIDAATDLPSVVAVGYPILDLMILALLARLVFSGGRPSAALLLLGTSVAVSLLADLVYNALALTSDLSEMPSALDALFSAGTALMAFAITSPGARSISQPLGHDAAMISPARMIALGVGALVGPTILVVQASQGDHPDMLLIACVTVAVNALVVCRVLLLLRTVRVQEEQLDEIARTDALTGLPNRRSWDFTLARTASALEEGGGSVIVAIADLDRFKEYNDELGHRAGDDLLASCAARWRQALPQEAFLARYGGEEFAVLLTDSSLEEAVAVMEAMRAATPTPATVSVGLSGLGRDERLERAFERADTALYQAKADGRDRIVVAYASDPES